MTSDQIKTQKMDIMSLAQKKNQSLGQHSDSFCKFEGHKMCVKLYIQSDSLSLSVFDPLLKFGHICTQRGY